jgi:DNA mismatch repair ATPase MutS
MLATTRTSIGQEALAALLLNPTTAEAACKRQVAVRELTSALDLREQVALLGASKFEEIPAETYEHWLQVETPAPAVWIRPLLIAVNLGWIALLLMGWLRFGAVASVVRPLESLLLAQGMLCLWLRPQVLEELKAAKRLYGQTTILRHGLRIVQGAKFESERLLELQRACAGQDEVLRLLERWLMVVEHREKEWFSALSLLFCGGTRASFGLRRWKKVHAEPMQRWLAAWSELEALLALATYAAEHADNVYAEIVDAAALFEAESMVHPLLPRLTAVSNDVRLGRETQFLLISGSNMAGKSTLLRTVGLQAVLALAGAPVPAKRLRLSPLQIGASLAVRDSLAEGKSKFLAEVERLREVLLLARANPTQCLFLIDEILSGTNSADRHTAAGAVLRGLLKAGAVGALSTHDLALTELAEIAELGGCNVHMASPNDEDPLEFDYRLKPGKNRTTNALAIVRLLGLMA